jgi:hypothetical protein
MSGKDFGRGGKDIPNKDLNGSGRLNGTRAIAATTLLLLLLSLSAAAAQVQGQVQGQGQQGPVQGQGEIRGQIQGQDDPSLNPQANAQADPALEPQRQPSGPLDAIGRWVHDSVSTAGAGIGAAWRGTVTGIGGIGSQAGNAAKDATEVATKGAAEVAKGAANVAKGAADVASTAAKLPVSHVASGRERCTIAPNGAPDCRAAAEALCKIKGFKGGTSIDFENAENCPAATLLAGRSPAERNCPTDYFVTRSLCQ